MCHCGAGNDMRNVYKGVLKDFDVQTPFMLPPDLADQLGMQLRTDIEFLAQEAIMDYSILLGVTNDQYPVRAEDRKLADVSCMTVGAVAGPVMYSVGIIDVLQPFSFRKRVEFVYKRFLCCRGRGVSACPPNQYARRMIENVVEALIERSPLKNNDRPLMEQSWCSRPVDGGSHQAESLLVNSLLP